MFYSIVGFDPITQEALPGKDAKALQCAKDAIQKSYDVGIEPYASFLVGNDNDDEGVFDRIDGNENVLLDTKRPGVVTPIWS